MKQEQFDVRTGRLENVAEPIDDRFGPWLSVRLLWEQVLACM